MIRWLLAGALLAVPACGGHGTRQEACTQVDRIDSGEYTGPIDTVVAELKATQEAGKSTDPGLREAARRTSEASTLDPSSPFYVNPGDVRYNAVAGWCHRH